MRVFILVLLASSLGLVSSCKPKATSAAAGGQSEVVEAAQKVPEGTNVLAALEQKDYENALAGLARIQQAVQGTEQEALYVVLRSHVKDKIMELSPTDPKAAEAVPAIRALILGR